MNRPRTTDVRPLSVCPSARLAGRRTMSLWDALSHSLRSLMNTHPLVVIAAILFFEELGVPSPLPGDVMMMLAGVRAAQGSHPLWAALLVQELATVAGAT